MRLTWSKQSAVATLLGGETQGGERCGLAEWWRSKEVVCKLVLPRGGQIEGVPESGGQRRLSTGERSDGD